MRITSLHNERVKLAIKLRDRKARKSQGRILIDGAREILRAWKAGLAWSEFYVCPEFCQTENAQHLLYNLQQPGAPIPGDAIFEVSPEVFEKLAYGERNEGIVAVAYTPETALQRYPALDLKKNGQPPLVVVLEQVEKPGNVGAVLRSADGAGASALVAASPLTDLYNPNAIRASLGTIFHMPLGEAPSLDVKKWLVSHDVTIYAARTDGAKPFSQCDFRGPVAFVLGNESQGLSPVWTTGDVKSVSLPMLGVADSLNVSITASVLLYEARRQRTPSS